MTDFLQNAIKAMNLMPKERAVASVLAQRIACLDKVIPLREGTERAHYEGKREGYMQAIELIGSSLASVRIELQEQ